MVHRGAVQPHKQLGVRATASTTAGVASPAESGGLAAAATATATATAANAAAAATTASTCWISGDRGSQGLARWLAGVDKDHGAVAQAADKRVAGARGRDREERHGKYVARQLTFTQPAAKEGHDTTRAERAAEGHGSSLAEANKQVMSRQQQYEQNGFPSMLRESSQHPDNMIPSVNQLFHR